MTNLIALLKHGHCTFESGSRAVIKAGNARIFSGYTAIFVKKCYSRSDMFVLR